MILKFQDLLCFLLVYVICIMNYVANFKYIYQIGTWLTELQMIFLYGIRLHKLLDPPLLWVISSVLQDGCILVNLVLHRDSLKQCFPLHAMSYCLLNFP